MDTDTFRILVVIGLYLIVFLQLLRFFHYGPRPPR